MIFFNKNEISAKVSKSYILSLQKLAEIGGVLLQLMRLPQNFHLRLLCDPNVYRCFTMKTG